MNPPYAHGLVIGKFYPPHAGHHLLVDRAAAACRRVTVVVAAHPHETISLAQRTAWLTAAHAGQSNVRVVGDVDPHPVDFGDEAVWAGHVQVFLSAVTRAARLDGLVPAAARLDAVFSSELYGQELARRLGAVCVHVDLDRSAIPVSGTQIRDDVVAGWSWLHPATRAGLALRVVVPDLSTITLLSAPFLLPAGSRSDGDGLAAAVAARLTARGGAWQQTVVVPSPILELASYKLAAAAPASAPASGSALVPGPGSGFAPAPVPAPSSVPAVVWSDGDFVDLAAEQVSVINRAAEAGGPVVLATVDPVVVRWCFERCLGPRPAGDETAARLDRLGTEDPTHLYLIPPSLAGSGLAAAISATGRRVVLPGAEPDDAGPVAGAGPETGRPVATTALVAALAAVDELVLDSWRFAAPLVGDPRDSLALSERSGPVRS
jgi:cytidyltransferase-like protein